MLMTAARTKDGLLNSKDKETIEKMEGELTNVIQDFDRAVNIEALRLAKETGKRSLSQPSNKTC
jgi:ABC-type histidine transport system ATPase subunit